MILSLLMILWSPVHAGELALYSEPRLGELALGLSQSAQSVSSQLSSPPQQPGPKIVPKPAHTSLISDETQILIRRKFRERGTLARPGIILPKLDDNEVVKVTVGKSADEAMVGLLNDDDGEDETLSESRASYPPSINPNDYVEISQITFERDKIFVDLNGGGPKTKRFKGPITVDNGSGSGSGAVIKRGSGAQENTGVTLVFLFDKQVPEMTLEEFQALLEPFLNFKAIRDEATQSKWDNVPEEGGLRNLVKSGHIKVGMDTYAVQLAMEGYRHLKPASREDDSISRVVWIYDLKVKTILIYFAPKMVDGIPLWFVEKIYDDGKQVDID